MGLLSLSRLRRQLPRQREPSEKRFLEGGIPLERFGEAPRRKFGFLSFGRLRRQLPHQREPSEKRFPEGEFPLAGFGAAPRSAELKHAAEAARFSFIRICFPVRAAGIS